jgi:hypothetical protein
MSLSKSSSAIKISAAILGSAALGYGLYKLFGSAKEDGKKGINGFNDKNHGELIELTKQEAEERSKYMSHVQYNLTLSFLPNSETYEGYVEIFFNLS